MTTPTGRREALEILTRRELSQRKVCRYLGLSRRVATYTLKQPEKDRSLDASLRSQDVILTLSRFMPPYGKPAFVRSDNGAIYRCQGHALAARRCNRSGLHRAWQSMAKRIRRKLQRQTARRIAKPRMGPQPRRGQGAHRTLAAVL